MCVKWRYIFYTIAHEFRWNSIINHLFLSLVLLANTKMCSMLNVGAMHCTWKCANSFYCQFFYWFQNTVGNLQKKYYFQPEKKLNKVCWLNQKFKHTGPVRLQSIIAFVMCHRHNYRTLTGDSKYTFYMSIRKLVDEYRRTNIQTKGTEKMPFSHSFPYGLIL